MPRQVESQECKQVDQGKLQSPLTPPPFPLPRDKWSFDALLQLRDAKTVASQRGVSLEKVFKG